MQLSITRVVPSLAAMIATEIASTRDVSMARTLSEDHSMTVETLISSLSQEDKRNALELLWASIERDAEQFTPPAWHAQVLADLGVSALGSLMFSDNSQNSLTKCENVGSSSQTVPDTCLIPFGCPRFRCQSIARKDLENTRIQQS